MGISEFFRKQRCLNIFVVIVPIFDAFIKYGENNG